MSTPHGRRWHHDSQFTDGPRVPLDRNARARLAFLLAAHHRAGRLTRATRDVGRALLRRLGGDGQLDPSHATLAEDAACSERTVERACCSLRRLGLLSWVRRLMRDGSICRQTSNGYRLLPTGTDPIMPTGARLSRIADRQADGGISFEILEVLPSTAIEAAQAALARRRAAFAERWAMQRRAARG